MQIMTLMFGTLMAQIIMFISIPLLTRLYTPSEFGFYATFLAISSLIGSVSSLKYDQAIMLPKSNRDAEALLFLSTLLTFFVTIFSILIITIFYDYILSYFGGSIMVVYLLPLGIFLIGIVQIFNAYATRLQLYKKLSIVRISNAFSLVSIQGFSRYLFNLDGLIVGKIFSSIISLGLLLRFILKKQTFQLASLSKRRVKLNAKRYHHFPKYQSFTVFLGSLSQNMPILFFGSLYSPEVAGFYALTLRVLYAPIGLIGKSTKEVYYQKASKMFANGESLFSLYFKTTMGLFKLFIIPFFVIFFFGEEIFSFLFESHWKESGVYAEILIFWFLIAFINLPSIATFSILSLQHIQLRLEIFSLIFRAISIYVGFYFFQSELVSIGLYSLTSFIFNALIVVYIYLQLKK